MSFNHQTVYRLLSRLSQMQPPSQLFQSPNGVQIALGISVGSCSAMPVSITKRCTDCFSKKYRKMYISAHLIFYIIQHLIYFLNAFVQKFT